MSDSRDARSGRYRPMLAAGLVVAGLVLGALYRLSAAGSAPGAATRFGMEGYRDPETGEFTEPPPDVAADLAARAARPASRLVERPGPTAGGGVLLDGVPLGSMIATVDADGHVSARCGSEP